MEFARALESQASPRVEPGDVPKADVAEPELEPAPHDDAGQQSWLHRQESATGKRPETAPPGPTPT